MSQRDRAASSWDQQVTVLLTEHLATYSAQWLQRLLDPVDAGRSADERRADLAQWREDAALELKERGETETRGAPEAWREKVLAPMSEQLFAAAGDSLGEWRERVAVAVASAVEADGPGDGDHERAWFVLSEALRGEPTFTGLIDVTAAAADHATVVGLRDTIVAQGWTQLRELDFRRSVGTCTALVLVSVVLDHPRLEELKNRLDVMIVLAIDVYASLELAA